MEEKKLAIFDIDGTLIDCDSMFKLMIYTFKNVPQYRIKCAIFFVKLITYCIGIIDTKQIKEEAFRCLNYLDEEEIKNFTEGLIQHYLLEEAYNMMKDLKKDGYMIVLISASPICYMKYFKQLEEVDEVLGTVMKKRGSRYTNKIIGENCKGKEKVRRIEEWINERNLKINLFETRAFSDSMSDIPILEWANKGYIVNNRKARYKNKLEWRKRKYL